MTAASHDLVRDFDQAMMQIYVQAKEQEGYTATRFSSDAHKASRR